MKTAKTLVPISNRSGKAIVPPPTRKEVVEALVLKLAQEHEASGRKWSEDMAKMKKEVRDAIVIALNKELLEKVVDPEHINHYEGRITVSVSIYYKELPHEVVRLVQQLNQLRDSRPGMFRVDEARKAMREALQADPARVKALAGSKEIELTLAHIKKNMPKPIKTYQNGCQSITLRRIPS